MENTNFNINQFVVTWSPHQDAFSIETIGEMLETNQRIFFDGCKGDFIVLAFVDTHSDGMSVIKLARETKNSSLSAERRGQAKGVNVFNIADHPDFKN